MIKKTIFGIFTALLLSTPTHALLSEQDRAKVETVRNYLQNPGFEGRTVSWTSTGSAVFSIISSGQLEGNLSATWDPSATGEFLSGQSFTVPEGLKGRRCAVQFEYKWTGGSSGEIELQAYDGSNIVVALPLEPTSSTVPSRSAVAVFTCPTSGTLQWRLASTADAAVITLDKGHIGIPTIEKNVASTELIAVARYATTSNCIWSTSSASLAAFGTDSDCPAITVDISSGNAPINAADNDLPDIVFTSLPPGRYKVQASLTGNATSATGVLSYAISDGTDVRGNAGVRDDNTTAQNAVTVTASFEYTTAGAKTFALFGSVGSGNNQVFVNSEDRELIFTITRYPLDSQTVLFIDQTDWKIDVNIGGSNVSLGTSAQSAYTGITDSGLDMVLNPGSHGAEIPCSSTNPSTGLTCAAGDESIGVVATIPSAGDYEVCAAFSHSTGGNASAVLRTTFQWVETDNADQNIDLEGNDRVSHIISCNAAGVCGGASPYKVCGEFQFASGGEKTMRLFYEQSVTGTVTSSDLLADRDASNGQRDIHITMKRINGSQKGFRIDNLVSNTRQLGSRVEAAHLDCDGASTINGELGSWISSLGNISSGRCTLNFQAGIFSAAPFCVIIEKDNAIPANVFSINATTTSKTDIDCRTSAGGVACTAWEADILCMGAN